MPFLLVSPRAEARPAVGAADRGGGAVAVAVEVEVERGLEAGDAPAAHHADAHAEDGVAVRKCPSGDGHLAERSGDRQGLCLSLCGRLGLINAARHRIRAVACDGEPTRA